MPDIVNFRIENQIGFIELNRPSHRNALNTNMIRKLRAKLKEWQHSETISVVVLQAVGDKAFCAGGDLVDLYIAIEESQEKRILNNFAIDFFENEYRLDYLIHKYPKPFVVLADGPTFGGGVGLMNGGSHRVVTENSLLSMPEISIGLFPDVGASYFLSQMPGKLGTFLGLTGARIKAADSIYLKLADYYIESEQINGFIQRLLNNQWEEDVNANHNYVTHVLSDLNQISMLSLTSSTVRQNAKYINSLVNRPTFPEVYDALLEAKDSKNNWLSECIANFLNGSPTSAYLTFEQLERSKTYSLEEAFIQELSMAAQCMLGHDFREGIRALLIDKDKSPSWYPDDFMQIKPQDIDIYFQSPFQKHPLADL